MSKYKKLMNLNDILKKTNIERYAVGSFSPRYSVMIKPIIEAAIELNSPVIVQISQLELERYSIKVKDFAEKFFEVVNNINIDIPISLHLDHTYDVEIIKKAIDSGFTSVMIDASSKIFSENVRITKEVVEYAHKRGVSVEGELGRILTADNAEAISSNELYTNPKEAKEFVEKTNVDALAVSVGTAHGVYKVKEPTIEYELLKKIKRETDTYIVLHGGSGVPASMLKKAIRLEGGGVSKVNIATDLELATLKALSREERIKDSDFQNVDKSMINKAQKAVLDVVKDKIINCLNSCDKKEAL